MIKGAPMRKNDAENNRHRVAVKMKEAGLTYQEIGDVFGVTKGRAWQIVKVKEYRRSWRKAKLIK